MPVSAVTKVSYHIGSAIAPVRRSTAADSVDSSSVVIAKIGSKYSEDGPSPTPSPREKKTVTGGTRSMTDLTVESSAS